MGFNTTVVVLNDALDYIKDDHGFGESLFDAVLKSHMRPSQPIGVRAGSHGNAAMVIEQHHADYTHAVLVGGNYGRDLGYVGGYSLDPKNPDHTETLIRTLADSLGFKVSLRKKVSR